MDQLASSTTHIPEFDTSIVSVLVADWSVEYMTPYGISFNVSI